MIKWFRLMRWLYYHKLKFLANFIRKVIRLYYSCDIYPTCQIGNGTTFYHQGLGCVFHERVVIDKDCKIYQNVTFGGNGKENQLYPGAPHICEGATVYAGACILGPIRVGKNAIVGANAVVLKDIPDNCVAVGVPAVIREKSSDVL
jgi:serine O-acetyltransferase